MVDGKVVVEAGAFEEGVTVTVVADECGDKFTLGASEEAELLDASRDADQDDFVDTEAFLHDLPRVS